MKRRTGNIPDREHFCSALRDMGMRATSQRLAVHDAMLALEHASADMVSDFIRENSSVKISGASVYNILSQMADRRIYSRRMSGAGKMFFDVDPSKHMHLYDTRYNEFRNIPDKDLLELVENSVKGRKFKGYRIDGVDIQIICHSTRRKKEL